MGNSSTNGRFPIARLIAGPHSGQRLGTEHDRLHDIVGNVNPGSIRNKKKGTTTPPLPGARCNPLWGPAAISEATT